MNLEREFYSLSSLAETWKCSIEDLIHLGVQDRAQICVNIYGLSNGERRTRHEVHDLPGTDEEISNISPGDVASYERWRSRTTKEMPPGIFEMPIDELRFFALSKGRIHGLSSALKFHMGHWWDVEFDREVKVVHENLCILHEEKLRLDRDVFLVGETAQPAKTELSNSERKSLMLMLYAMAKQKFQFDPAKARSDTVPLIQSAIEQAGYSLSDKPIKRYLDEAAAMYGKPKP